MAERIVTNAASFEKLSIYFAFARTADDSLMCFDCVFEHNKLKSERFQRTCFESNVSLERITLRQPSASTTPALQKGSSAV